MSAIYTIYSMWQRRAIPKLVILVAALLLTRPVASAQAAPPLQESVNAAEVSAVSTVLHFQGLLIDPGTNEPKPDGVYAMQFRIYNVATDGTALWTESKNVTVNNGTLSTSLGDTTALDPAIFNGQDLWLGVKVGADGEMTPRHPLTTVPYAFYATNADKLDGYQASSFYTRSASDSRYVNTAGPDSMTAKSTSPSFTVANTDQGSAIGGTTSTTTIGGADVYGVAGTAGPTISNFSGLLGTSTDGAGVVGSSIDSYGSYGYSKNSSGMRGEGYTGVFGLATNSGGYGVYGHGGSTTSGVYGYTNYSSGDGVYGNAAATTGAAWGVRGTSASTSGRGVTGFATAATGTTYGVYGSSSSSSGRGVYGSTSSSTGTTYAVYGDATSPSGRGVYGQSPYIGVYGYASGSSGYSVYGYSGNSGTYAGYFNGKTHVNGTFTASSKLFKIDHPLDPENKYLNHTSVESPDMLNLYTGVTVLDGNGSAWVQMPDWFEALNRDFTYQLTPIGGPGPNLYIATEVQNNRFQIAGGTANLKVSWQVTGIRHDAYAEAHRTPVEEDKPPEEQGSYLHPIEWGQPESRGVDFSVEPVVEEQGGIQAAGEFYKPAGPSENATISAID